MKQQLRKAAKQIGETPVTIFWFRRDLRLADNHGLYRALISDFKVLPIFIFDTNILNKLKRKTDARVQFIYENLKKLHTQLTSHASGLLVLKGSPEQIFKDLLNQFNVKQVIINHDYEPYAIRRDSDVAGLCRSRGIEFSSFKDQVIFEKSEIGKADGHPYTVYTPYSKKWMQTLAMENLVPYPSEQHLNRLISWKSYSFPPFEEIGFASSDIPLPQADISDENIKNYHETRDFPGIEGTTKVGVHLRFGTISIRSLVRRALQLNEVYLKELIWREFFMQALWLFPHIEQAPFRKMYASFPWRHDEGMFETWCQGKTGFPMVDAGMRELNATGFMHNRVRMLTANFLTKLLGIDWRWGERYFAERLLDYECASNVGNWQWSAGCGMDAAPYFRIFNPDTQKKKFDPGLNYIKKWIPEIGTGSYPKPMIDYKDSREKYLTLAKNFLDSVKNENDFF